MNEQDRKFDIYITHNGKHLGIYNPGEQRIELDVAWPSWKHILEPIIPELIIEAIIHEEIHAAVSWGGCYDHFWDHEIINNIFKALGLTTQDYDEDDLMFMNKIAGGNNDRYWEMIAGSINSRFLNTACAYF